MKVLFAASECTPFIKTGGLADVIGTLPVALAKQGVDARVILPKYKDIPELFKSRMKTEQVFYVNLGWRKQYCGVLSLEQSGVTYYFIDNEYYFGNEGVYSSGNYEGERFSFFCRAVLETIVRLGLSVDILHLNDWQTGMIAPLLATQYRANPLLKNVKTAFTIHNLRFQGIFPWLFIDDLLGLDDQYFRSDMLEYYGCVNFLKAGIVFSDVITTVSPSYANEIQTPYFGERMDGLLRAKSASLVGILNGIDPNEYDPATDPVIPAHFSAEDLSGKAECKAALQRDLGLEANPDVPIIAMVSRLTSQKGIDLIDRVIDDMMRTDLQFVVLGTGEQQYHDLFGWASWRYSGRFATRIEHSNALSHRIFAGADMLLMPSQFEPCGLTQMIAMRYGTIPIVRETGGLRDSVQPYNRYTDEGTGFSFANYNAHEMLFTIESAVGYYHDKAVWPGLMQRTMAQDFSWTISAKKYLDLYDSLLAPKPLDPKEGEVVKAPKASTKASKTATKTQAANATDAAKQPAKPKRKPAAKPAEKATTKTTEKAAPKITEKTAASTTKRAAPKSRSKSAKPTGKTIEELNKIAIPVAEKQEENKPE